MILKVKNYGGGWVYYDNLHGSGVEMTACRVTSAPTPVKNEPDEWPVFIQENEHNGCRLTVEHTYLTMARVSDDTTYCHLAVIYADKNDGPPFKIAFDEGYLMNDDGKTIESFKPII